MLAFAVAAVFLPQERNELIGIAFFVAGLAFCNKHSVKESTKNANPSILAQRKVQFLLATGVLGWVVVTSPTYVFPALEVAQLYGKEIVKEKQQVLVTEPKMQGILGFLIKVMGGHSSQVSVLVDGHEALYLDQSWIIWNPARWKYYPKLVRQLASSDIAYQTSSLNLSLPPSWWLMPSAQPVVSFFFSGLRKEIAAPQTSPNQAPYANIVGSNNILNVDTLTSVADYNYGTAIQWDMAEHTTIQFEFSSMQRRLLRVYRLTALPFRNSARADFYHWNLEGSHDNLNWINIDQRTNHRLSQDGKSPSAFITMTDKAYRYYRFRFIPKEPKVGVVAGIAEIELYFSPSY